MADTLSDNLYTLIESKNTWTAPCTFTRTNAMPLDPKSCFNTKNDLDTFLADPQCTAYPGMVVAVTNCEDAGQGLYIITSNGSELVPTKLGTKAYVDQKVAEVEASATMEWLTGDEGEEEGD